MGSDAQRRGPCAQEYLLAPPAILELVCSPMKRIILTLCKISIVGGLLYWLVQNDRLDFSQLKIFAERTDVLAYQLGLFVFGYLIMGSWRWHILLRGLDLKVSYPRTMILQGIGFFFNTALPGAIGGDIIKAIYVMREQQSQRKTPALITILLDRAAGMAALLTIAAGAVILNPEFVSNNPKIWPLALFSLAGIAGLALVAIVILFPFADGRDPFLRLLAGSWPGAGKLRGLYEALKSYQSRPGALGKALLISVAIQLVACHYTWYVTRSLTGQSPDFLAFCLVYPLALITTVIPLAPGGMGVGHVAFDSFFHLAGWSDGANVFNVTVLGSLSLQLLGVIPYILFRSKLPAMPKPDELEALQNSLEPSRP